MPTQRYKEHKESDKHDTPLKETNKVSITGLKEMEIFELSDKEIRIIILKGVQ